MERKYWITIAIIIIGVVAAGALINSYVLTNTPKGFLETTPSADFNYTYDASNETLAVTHTGGSEFTRSTTQRLEVYVTKGKTPNVTKVRPNETVLLPFRIGETITVSDVKRNDMVYLIWWESGDKNGDRAIIAKNTVGDAETG